MQDYTRVLQQPSAQEVARRFMSGVYLRMMVAVFVSAASGFVFNTTGFTLGALQTLGRGYVWTVLALQLGTLFLFQGAQRRLKVAVVQGAFAFYALLMGLTLSLLGYMYTLSSLVGLFGLAVVGFGALAGFGAVTRRDLGPVGSFCLMGAAMLFGMSILMLLGTMFPGFASFLPTFNKVAGLVGILVFSGLTAYESQKIRLLARALPQGPKAQNEDGEHSTLMWGAAFSMYLNFIGLFLSLVRVFGSRK